MMNSPEAKIEKLSANETDIFVVRDDLLHGGTKQRAAIPYVQKLKEKGITHFVYASPFSGFAQIALAHACQHIGLKCTIFAVRDPSSVLQAPHEFTRIAAFYGAQIELSDNLKISDEFAEEFEKKTKCCFKVPLGFNDPVFSQLLMVELEIQWSLLTRKLQVQPKNVWVSLGSGTMARALRAILPDEVTLNVVDVHVLSDQDERIQSLKTMENIFYHSAEQIFEKESCMLPPVPSNKYYDSKVWKKLLNHSDTGDLWWNIAR